LAPGEKRKTGKREGSQGEEKGLGIASAEDVSFFVSSLRVVAVAIAGAPKTKECGNEIETEPALRGGCGKQNFQNPISLRTHSKGEERRQNGEKPTQSNPLFFPFGKSPSPASVFLPSVDKNGPS